jgi:hypothetical protein
LDETPNDDVAWRMSAARLEQFDVITGTHFDVAYGSSSRHEIAYHPSTLNKLTTGGASNLNNMPVGFLTPIGPAGNMTWALQWDMLLAPDDGLPGGPDEYQICKDCQLQMVFPNVPEPASWTLVAIGAIVLLRVRGRR